MTADTLAIRALALAAQRARREGSLAELASLRATLRWYEGALAYQQQEAARASCMDTPATQERRRAIGRKAKGRTRRVAGVRREIVK